MLRTKLAIGGLTAGIVLSGWSLIDDQPATRALPAAPAPVSAAAIDQPVVGLTPIDEIVDLWQQRSDNQPLDYLSRTQLGLSLSQRGREQAELADHERAEAAHRSALDLNPSHQPAQLGLASALMAQHRFDDAHRILTNLVDADPSSLSALMLLGDAELELGNYDAASNVYQHVVNREPSGPALARLARLAAVQTTPDQARGLAEDALAATDLSGLRPSQAAFYWLQLGHHRFNAGDIDGAEQALETALDHDPTNPGATEKLAFVLHSAGRLTEAGSLYQQLLATGPAADLHGLYADLLRQTGDLEGAHRHDVLGDALADEARDRYPAERRHLIGFYQPRDADLAVELARLDLAERRDVGAYDALAWSLFHRGDLGEAAEVMRRALVHDTRDARLRYHAAAIAHANGDTDTARSHLELALAINPHFHPTEHLDAADLASRLGVRMPAS